MEDLKEAIIKAVKKVGFSKDFIKSIKQEKDCFESIVDRAIQVSSKKAKKALAIMSNSKDWNIRWEVAKNSNIPFYVLRKLASDKEWYVRCGVIENLKTPTIILEKLFHDKEWRVRIGAQQQLYQM